MNLLLSRLLRREVDFEKIAQVSSSPNRLKSIFEGLIAVATDRKKWQQQYSQIRKILVREKKRAEKREQLLQQRLLECKEWASLRHEADLIKANFGGKELRIKELVVWDWLQEKERSIPLNPAKTLMEEMELRYKTAKKMERGIEKIESELQKASAELRGKNELLLELESLYFAAPFSATLQQLIARQEQFEVIRKERIVAKALPYHLFHSKKGISILVGKNARSNEVLTFQIARGNDYWLHVKGVSGSHVVIQSKAPDEETIREAAQLAVRFSKASKEGKAEVCITQKKFVSRLKGKLGKVQVAKHRTVTI